MKRTNSIRLNKEEQSLLKDPIDMAVFHFCLFGLDGDYEGGYYHGALLLPEDYPFSPPELRFYTPSGYFETDKAICTTFTNYHRETWSALWSVQSMVHGVISFMLAGDPSVGVKIMSSEVKKKCAKQSMSFNTSNPIFLELFGKEKFVINWRQKQQEKDRPVITEVIEETVEVTTKNIETET